MALFPGNRYHLNIVKIASFSQKGGQFDKNQEAVNGKKSCRVFIKWQRI